MTHADEEARRAALTEFEQRIVAYYHAHRAHGPSDSLYGRCEGCGLPWGTEARARQIIKENDL